MTINLENFFYYYDRQNPQHRLAVELLSEQIDSRLLSDSSDWVQVYRKPLEAPASADPEKSIAATESIRPSHTGVIDWDNPRSYVSEFFTVGEVIQMDRRRIPTDQKIKENIFTLAKMLDEVRRLWGSPIGVTSWYRPPQLNAALGGVRNSQHISGRAVDVYPLNRENARFEKWLDTVAWKDRALGYGMASGRGFTHLDLRKGRIRWRY